MSQKGNVRNRKKQKLVLGLAWNSDLLTWAQTIEVRKFFGLAKRALQNYHTPDEVRGYIEEEVCKDGKWPFLKPSIEQFGVDRAYARARVVLGLPRRNISQALDDLAEDRGEGRIYTIGAPKMMAGGYRLQKNYKPKFSWGP